jgi:hypothetical protein
MLYRDGVQRMPYRLGVREPARGFRNLDRGMQLLADALHAVRVWPMPPLAAA